MNISRVVNTKLACFIIGFLAILGSLAIFFADKIYQSTNLPIFSLTRGPNTNQGVPAGLTSVKAFTSADEFKAYLTEAQALNADSGTMGFSSAMGRGIMAEGQAVPVAAPPTVKYTESEGSGGGSLNRVSETNVQVLGIDEPDVVKTDGQQIYFSKQQLYYAQPMMEKQIAPGIMPPRDYQKGGVKIIKALPASEISLTGEIDQQGELLLSNKILIVFNANKIYGYDVANPKSPLQKWMMDMEYRDYLAAARLKEGKLYLVLRRELNVMTPCPYQPLKLEGGTFEIKCSDIYHPLEPVPTDSTFTVLKVNPESGQIEKSLAFVGSSGQSVVYMSDQALYLTYSYQEDFIKFFYNFLSEKGKDLVPSWVMTKLGRLMNYDLSQQAKMTEFQTVLQTWRGSLNQDESLKVSNELSNRLADYQKEHLRELEKTGIAKIGLDSFKVDSVGAVPGHPLNQFSLDEYNNHLRIAVTIGGRNSWYWYAFGSGSSESANDVYVLDDKLKVTGSITDMGLTERIYSARFLGNRGYLVTFRETDPFYVLDLSDPQNPQKKGELKVPGYSSYLHPLADNLILGLGKEGNQVKISLFDVKNPQNPQEIAKYALDEYWSEILNTYHAFLQDAKHQVFFLPGGKGGYIFSYADNKIQLLKAVSSIQAKRALYINDYLYIIGEDKITVLNEQNWETVKNFSF